MKKDVVIRISEANHRRLKRLMEDVIESGDKKPTINELMEELLDSMENVKHGKLIYLVGETAFEDVSLARGEAIVRAVSKKDVPQWPKVAVILGEDHG